MREINVGVHVGHCCLKHGCKYSSEDCPVVLRTADADGTCSYCYEERLEAGPVRFEEGIPHRSHRWDRYQRNDLDDLSGFCTDCGLDIEDDDAVNPCRLNARLAELSVKQILGLMLELNTEMVNGEESWYEPGLDKLIEENTQRIEACKNEIIRRTK